MRPDQISAHMVRALQAVGYSQREAERMLAEHDAGLLREAIAAVQDPEQRALSPIGMGLGWESAREVLRRLLAEVAGRAA